METLSTFITIEQPDNTIPQIDIGYKSSKKRINTINNTTTDFMDTIYDKTYTDFQNLGQIITLYEPDVTEIKLLNCQVSNYSIPMLSINGRYVQNILKDIDLAKIYTYYPDISNFSWLLDGDKKIRITLKSKRNFQKEKYSIKINGDNYSLQENGNNLQWRIGEWIYQNGIMSCTMIINSAEAQIYKLFKNFGFGDKPTVNFKDAEITLHLHDNGGDEKCIYAYGCLSSLWNSRYSIPKGEQLQITAGPYFELLPAFNGIRPTMNSSFPSIGLNELYIENSAYFGDTKKGIRINFSFPTSNLSHLKIYNSLTNGENAQQKEYLSEIRKSINNWFNGDDSTRVKARDDFFYWKQKLSPNFLDLLWKGVSDTHKEYILDTEDYKFVQTPQGPIYTGLTTCRTNIDAELGNNEKIKKTAFLKQLIEAGAFPIDEDSLKSAYWFFAINETEFGVTENIDVSYNFLHYYNYPIKTLTFYLPKDAEVRIPDNYYAAKTTIYDQIVSTK